MSDHLDVNGDNRVLIPSDLHATFGNFFSQMQRRALRLAAQRVKNRSPGDDYCFIQPEDFADAARQAMREFTGNVDDTFASHEPEHVRRAS